MADHARLFLEPWGFLPSQVAHLDRWQVYNLYLRPHAAMIAELKGERPPGPLRVSDELPDKATFVLGMQAEFGGTAEKWATDYDRMAAEVKASETRGE